MINVIDSHLHIWQLARGDYDWLTPDLPVLYKDFPIDEAIKQLTASQINNAILIQAAASQAETEYLLSIANQYSKQIAGVVGWVDFDDRHVLNNLTLLANDPMLCGIRPMLQDIEQSDWILTPQYHEVLNKISQLGLVFDALISAVHLPVIIELAKAHPNLSIVVNHCAKPDLKNNALAKWKQDILSLAQFPNVTVKLSGLPTECAEQFEPTLCFQCLAWVVACFTYQRVLWGSDWPVVNIHSNYQQWLNFSLTSLEKLSLTEEQITHVFFNNANHVYSLAKGIKF